MKDIAARLKKDWDQVFKPEGREPYFELGDGSVPVFEPGRTDFSPVNAWLLVELSRLIYTPCEGESKGDPSDLVRHRHLERIGLREKVSLNRRSNHVSVLESDAAGGFTVVSCRGTMSAKQWVLNLNTIPVWWSDGAYVHQGFKLLFEELWFKLQPHLESARRPIIFSGHSLGGALAGLAASKFAPDVLYTFGAPRIGNTGFNELLAGIPIHRVVNRNDIVTMLPHAVDTLAPYDFHHTGDLHYFSRDGRHLLNPTHEDLPEETEKVEQPLSFLMESFDRPTPPNCLVDHAALNYRQSLERWMDQTVEGAEEGRAENG